MKTIQSALIHSLFETLNKPGFVIPVKAGIQYFQ